MSEQKTESSAPAVHVRLQQGSALGFILAVLGWLAGIVLAKGWLTLLATVFAPYGWYLVVEAIMRKLGLAP